MHTVNITSQDVAPPWIDFTRDGARANYAAFSKSMTSVI
jgi:hypothetical protein